MASSRGLFCYVNDETFGQTRQASEEAGGDWVRLGQEELLKLGGIYPIPSPTQTRLFPQKARLQDLDRQPGLDLGAALIFQ